MRYTEAIETSGTIWPLEEFLRKYDGFNIVVNSGKWYGVFLNKDINTITCIAKNVRMYSVQEITDNPERFEIRVLGTMYCICLKWETVKLDASFADEHIVARRGSEEEIDTIVQLCQKNDMKHIVYQNYADCEYCVVWEKDGVVMIWGHDGNSNYKKLEFKGVLKWGRVTKETDKKMYLYSFIVLEYKDYSVLMNLKTLLFIDITEKYVIPAFFCYCELRPKNGGKVVYECIGNEYMWVGNSLYDIKLKQCALLEGTELRVLDYYDYYIAVEDFCWIKIYKLNPKNDAGRHSFEIIEERYRCSRYSSTDCVQLYLDNNGLTNAYFDVLKKKFIILPPETTKSDSDVDDHYSLMDALDGEPDAYWNID